MTGKQFLYFRVAGIILLLSFNSCIPKHINVLSQQIQKNYNSAFIEGFKTLSLCSCLEYAYDRELKLWEEDVDCRVPDYLYTQKKVIDSLARKEAGKIIQAEAARNYQRAEGMEGKRIISTCIAFYNSTELDKIARAQLKADK